MSDNTVFIPLEGTRGAAAEPVHSAAADHSVPDPTTSTGAGQAAMEQPMGPGDANFTILMVSGAEVVRHLWRPDAGGGTGVPVLRGTCNSTNHGAHLGDRGTCSQRRAVRRSSWWSSCLVGCGGKLGILHPDDHGDLRRGRRLHHLDHRSGPRDVHDGRTLRPRPWCIDSRGRRRHLGARCAIRYRKASATPTGARRRARCGAMWSRRR